MSVLKGVANDSGAAIGGYITSGTPGSILYIGAGNLLAEDNADFFYDYSNTRFGLGTNTPLARQHLVVNAIGASPVLASGLLLDNQTPAAAGAQQYGPAIYIRSRGYATTPLASRTVDLRIQNVPIEGAAAPTGQMQFGYSINGGAFVNAMTVSSLGVLAVTGSFTCNGSLYNGATAVTSNIYVNSASTGTQTNASGIYFGTSGNISLRTVFNGTTNYTIPASNNYGALIIGAMPVTEASTGTHPVISNLILRSFAITNAGGATTDATTLYVEAAPTGVTPTGGLYSAIFDSGNVRIDDRLSVGTGTTPSAGIITIGSGTTQVAAIDFQSGTLLTTPARGKLEYDASLWYWTHGDAVRRDNATWLHSDAPAVSAAPIPTEYYGTGGVRMLSEPDAWLETVATIAGSVVNGRIPFYLPPG